MGAKETMRMTPRFVIRLPRATFLMATLAVLSLLAVTPAAKAQPFTQISLAGILNADANNPAEYNGDFRTGSVVNQSAPPPNVVAGPPGLTFAIPTVGNNVYFTAVGAPAVGPVTSPTIGIGVGSVTTVFALVNALGGFAGTSATFTFNGTGGATQTFTLLAGRDFRDFNNDGGTNTTGGQPVGQATAQFYGTAPGGVANGQSDHRLDLITFTLGPQFLGQTLNNLVIVDNGVGTIIGGVKQPGTSRIFLAGLVVSGAVPEPGPIALAAVAGLAGLVGYGRRYRGMVAGWFNREPKVG
jgi:hypothetical protein